MQVFEKNITVTKDDLDQINHVNNVRYVQWVQDIAEEHWLQNVNESTLKAFFWVLITHHIEYKGQAFLGDVLNVKTFVSKSEGITSIRHVEFYNSKTNKLICVSETKWCFMNFETKKPARIPADIATLFD